MYCASVNDTFTNSIKALQDIISNSIWNMSSVVFFSSSSHKTFKIISTANLCIYSMTYNMQRTTAALFMFMNITFRAEMSEFMIRF